MIQSTRIVADFSVVKMLRREFASNVEEDMTKLKLNLRSDGFTVTLDDRLNEWRAQGSCECLTFTDGKIDARGDRMILHTGGGVSGGNEPLLTLMGAKWTSAIGNTGEALNEGIATCEASQTWEVVDRS